MIKAVDQGIVDYKIEGKRNAKPEDVRVTFYFANGGSSLFLASQLIHREEYFFKVEQADSPVVDESREELKELGIKFPTLACK